MNVQLRIISLLALGFLLGAIFAWAGHATITATLLAVPLGFFSWFWILCGDVMRPWAIFTREGRDFIGPVLAGNSNLGSATTQRLAILGEVIRLLQVIAIGYMTPMLLGFADPVGVMPLVVFILPMVAWWVFSQIRSPS